MSDSDWIKVIGSVISLLLLANGWYFKDIVKRLSSIELTLVELVTKHDLVDKMVTKHDDEIDKIREKHEQDVAKIKEDSAKEFGKFYDKLNKLENRLSALGTEV
jgi:hypothetical protein